MKASELNPRNVCLAYCNGFFPMPESDTGEIMWYRPDPRAIIPLDGFHVSHSLNKKIKHANYKVSYDQNFAEVIKSCANRDDTWLTPDMIHIYSQLHMLGAAHSVEIKNENKELIGGVYGISLGGAFFAESMFHRADDASKLALYHLVERLKKRKFILLECQFMTKHLQSLGAKILPDPEYIAILDKALLLDVYF